MEKRIFTSFSLKKLRITSLVMLAFGFLATQSFGQNDCATATPQVAATGIVTGTLTGAVPNPCATLSSNTAWFEYTATADGTITASSIGTATVDTRLSILEGTCGNTTCLITNDDAVGLQSQASVEVCSGLTYYIVWDDRWTTAGFSWDLTYTAPVVLAGGEAPSMPLTPVTGTNTSPGVTGSVVSSCGNGIMGSTWYSYTPTSCGTIDVTSAGLTTVDTDLAILRQDGAICGTSGLTCIAANDDIGGGVFQSELLGIDVVAGETYFIEWSDRWSTAGFDWDFTFNAVPVAPTLNNLTFVGCDLTVDFDATCDGGTADVEICPDGLPAGDPGCTIFTAQTSPFVTDACAAGFNGVTTATVSTQSGDAAATIYICNTPISAFPYTEDFESGANGWFLTDVANSTWELTTPAGGNINAAASGVNAWVTNAAGAYNVNEDGWVQSPCYDFTGLCRPIIDMSIWWDSEFSWDGTVLQSSIDQGATWQNVGANGDPNNWFNDGTIGGNPGGQQEGWTGTQGGDGSGGYLLATHDLDGLAGISDVRLRVAFGSDGSIQSGDGFAFDDVMVYEPCDIAVAFTQSGGVCGGGGIPTINITASSAEAPCKVLEYSIDGGDTWGLTSDFTNLVDNECYDIVVRYAGDDNCSQAADAQACFIDILAPEAVCQDIDVQLVNGAYTLTWQEIDNGSTDNCGIDIDATNASLTALDCSSVGAQTITLTVVDQLGGLTDQCDAIVSVFADNSCAAGLSLGNEGGPSIADPCTCSATPGVFDEEVFLQSTAAGQAWTITSVTGLDPFAVGDLMTDNGDGTYSLVGTHLDGVGYSVTVESAFFPGVSLQVGNTCFYPEAVIENDLRVLCLNTPVMVLAGNAGGAAGTGAFKVNGVDATEVNTVTLGLGLHSVEFCFDAGTPTGTKEVNGVLTNSIADAMADPGCETCITQQFSIVETPSAFACNDNVQITANEDCETDITPDMILEGGTGSFCYDDYTVTLKNVPNPVTPTYFGRDIVATVMHLPSGNSCWGTVVIEDKSGPTVLCTVDVTDKMGTVTQSGQVINIDCETDPADIPAPEAEDNCDRYPIVSLQSEVETGDKCGGITLTRTYTASDRWNNEAATPCVITINIAQPQVVRFPDDVTWTCQQYEAYSSVIDASALHPLILAHAADIDRANYCNIAGNDGDDVIGVAPYGAGSYWTDGEDLDISLDPLFDDSIDNPITDTEAACNTMTGETDSRECDANFSYMTVNEGWAPDYLRDCDLNAGGHVPNNIRTPLHVRNAPLISYPANHELRGLEDNDVLEVTGSGVPSVSATGLCAFAVTHEDQKLEACNGIDTTKVFKIIRTWTVLNWCTGDVFTDAQVIKVLDKKAPVVVFNDDDDTPNYIDGTQIPIAPFGVADETQATERYGDADGYDDLLASDIYSQSSHPDCSSSGLIDVPTFLDDCTGISSVRVYTPAGEATAVEAGGQVIGYRIPSPYLSIGIHTITFEVMDGCGNTTTVDKRVQVEDGIPPVNICREYTQVALSSEAGGLTSLTAEHFNENTYDNCGPVWFLVRKMNRGDNCPGLREDNRFRDEVHFCCENIGDTVNIILRAYDRDPGVQRTLTALAANANDCMVQVTVEDKGRPTCAAPEDVWVNCDALQDNIDWDDVDQLNDLFGSAVATDNCNATASQIGITEDVDLCGIGTVTRRFRAEDDFGNRSLGTCSQTIMIMPVHEYTLNMPADFEEECDDASPGSVTYEEVGCDLIAINTEDEEFPVSDQGECKKILRTHQIIDWCLYDGQSDAVEIPRLDLNNDGDPGDASQWITTGGNLILIPNPLIQVGGGGFHQYQQWVKIFDETAPDVSYDGDTQFCGGDLNEDPCTGSVNIAVDSDDMCTGTSTRWELTAFSTLFSTPDFSGDDNLTGRYPLGTHTARFYVSDQCGNTSEYDVTFEVIDCKAPTPACYNGLSIDVMPLSGMVEIWAKDFDASSFDYCHPIKFEINRVTDQNGDGFIDANDYQSTNPGQDSVQFTCADAGTFVYVQMWVGELSGDGVNDWDYCVTTMEVQDNNNVCTGSRPASVAGTAKTADGATVTNVDVTISGAMDASVTTDNSGAFNFSNLVEGNDYSVTPMRTDDVVNGVSTFDLTIISKHILNIQALDSPYKMIAADANNSGNISTLDLIAIRKVILRVADEFPNNTSWRFVDKDQILDANPLGGTINEVKNFNDIAGDVKADFIAVKVGDVNGDAEAQDINGVDGRTFNGTFFLNADDASFEAGDKVEVTFTSDELTKVEGYQFTMNFNTKVLDLADVVEATAKSENFGLTMVENGIITTSWNGAAANNEAFTLVFVAKAAGTLSNELSVSSEYTVAEAYANGSLKNVGFNFGTTTATADFALYQNTPNPFENETSIGFNLPEAATATITLTDVSGKVLRVIKGDYAKGLNQISLEMTSNLPAGVVIYELETSTHKATRKMTVVK